MPTASRESAKMQTKQKAADDIDSVVGQRQGCSGLASIMDGDGNPAVILLPVLETVLDFC